MGMPGWWESRRYGLFVHASLASVPAWAPIGQDASWYRWHLGDVDINGDDGDAPQPMVEVVAHHRDRWGHIERFSGFLDLLDFDRFDAEEWAQLAVDAGAGYGVIVAKHRDGLCWWDAPGAACTTIDRGPKRNVVAEFAAACERHGLAFGTHCSPVDWGADRTDRSADTIAADMGRGDRQALDLVERYGSVLLRSDRPRGTPSGPPPDGELLARLRTAGPDLVVNDQWCSPGTGDAPPVVRTVDEVPTGITDGAWELCRSVGRGFGCNRNDRPEHVLTGFDIVALLTEVVAKGGHLLLSVGAQVDGSIAPLHRRAVLDAGTWIRTHRELVDRAAPWTTWGDEQVRYLTVDGVLHAVDVAGSGRFAALASGTHRVVGVHRVTADGAVDMHFTQGDDGLHLDLPRSAPWRRSVLPVHGDLAVDVAVYRIDVVESEQPRGLFGPVDRRPIALAPLLADAAAGEIVQLGDGVYHGPALVPPGVILRGLGHDRTTIECGGDRTLRMGRNSRIEHVAVTGAAPGVNGTASSAPVIAVDDQFATLLGCSIAGPVLVAADDALIRASSLTTVRVAGADRITISRCQLRGNRWDVGIELQGGADHEIDSCELDNHLCAIRATDTTGTVVRGNTIESRWWGVHFERTERAHAHGNRFQNTMRAVDVDGGTGALVDGNAVLDGDSGCVVEGGATDCEVAGNHWERCRLGLLAWDVTGLHHQNNHVLALHEPDHAVVVGP